MPDGSIRTWGSGPHGRSWTPVDPESVPDFRWSAGLPYENPGRFLIRGELVKPQNVAEVRRALELDGNPGGLPEYLIDDAADAVETKEVRGINEPWTQGPGSLAAPPKS